MNLGKVSLWTKNISVFAENIDLRTTLLLLCAFTSFQTYYYVILLHTQLHVGILIGDERIHELIFDLIAIARF